MRDLKEIALEYFDKHLVAKQRVIEKGYNLFPELRPPNLGSGIDITGTILKEEEMYAKVLTKGQQLLSKINPEAIDGVYLCKLHHTYGIDPSTVEDILNLNLPEKVHDDYVKAYEQHKDTGRKGHKPTAIKVLM